MSLCSWVAFLLSLASALDSRELVSVTVSPSQVTTCYKSVTLHCHITSTKELNIHSLVWIHEKRELCFLNDTTEHQLSPDHHCHANTNRTAFTLTLPPIRPVDWGKYICKLRAKQGAKGNSAHVQPQDCYRDFHYNISADWVTCIFTGVYPDGKVHWFHGRENVTDRSTPSAREPEEGGSYALTSTLHIGVGASGQPLNCSLWMPTTGVYVTSRLVNRGRESMSLHTGGRALEALWQHWVTLLVFLFLV